MIGFIAEYEPCKGYRFAWGAVQSVKVTPWCRDYGEAFAMLLGIVPQTYGEAIARYPNLPCEPHEWDNRTTIENWVWLRENGFLDLAE